MYYPSIEYSQYRVQLTDPTSYRLCYADSQFEVMHYEIIKPKFYPYVLTFALCLLVTKTFVVCCLSACDNNFCCLLIAFANSLDTGQEWQIVGPVLDPNCLTL